MASLRKDPPSEIGGIAVARIRDYENGDIKVTGLGVVEKTPISGSNVLYFDLIDGSALVVRPSGTEPKIKMYVLARDETAEGAADKAERVAAYARGLSK
jgi:phosphoglucomutase